VRGLSVNWSRLVASFGRSGGRGFILHPPILGANTFSIEAVVAVASFTCLLWWIPKAEVRALPAICALVFAPYWLEGAFVAYVACLFYGFLFTIVEGTGMFEDRS